MLRRNHLFVPAAQWRKFDFSKQSTICIHVAAGKKEAPNFKHANHPNLTTGLVLDRLSHGDVALPTLIFELDGLNHHRITGRIEFRKRLVV